MKSAQSKREQIHVNQMREYLLGLESFNQKSIDELDEQALKTIYYRTIEEEKIEKQIQTVQNQKEKNHLKEQNLKKKKKNHKKSAIAKKIDEKNNDSSVFNPDNESEVSSSKILEILTANMPQSAHQLSLLTSEELKELYDELLKSNQESKRHTPEYAKMREFISKVYPHLRSKIQVLSQRQIRDLYKTCSVDSSFSVNFEANYGQPMAKSSIKENKIIGSQGRTCRSESDASMKKQKKSAEEMKRELKGLIPWQSIVIDSFNDSEIEQLYQEQVSSRINESTSLDPTLKIQEQQKKNKKQKKKKKKIAQQQQQIPSTIQNIQKSSNSQCSNQIRNSSVDQNKTFIEWQHRDIQGIKARTYVFVHTQYSDPIKNNKYFAPFNSKDICTCSLCENNTLQNLFKELKSFMEHHQK